MNKTTKIILASNSPRRKKILSDAGFKFSIFASNVSEDSKILEPHKLTKLLSRKKAKAVLAKFPGNTVIAADTMVFLNNKLYGKPVDFEEAKRMLSTFSGNTHLIVTGITLITDKKIITKSDEAHIKLRKLTEKEIDAFLKSSNPYDKAGGYSVEELPKNYIVNIRGEMSTVLGLPIHLIRSYLQF